MNMQIAFLLVAMCINILIGIGIILACIYTGRRLKDSKELNERMYLFSLPINNEENFMIIDRMVEDEVKIYQIYNLPMGADDLYINEEEQNKMLEEILKNVLKKISPVYMAKLKYIYNEEIVVDIIFEKVRDAVLNFTVEINGTFRDQEKNNQ